MYLVEKPMCHCLYCIKKIFRVMYYISKVYVARSAIFTKVTVGFAQFYITTFTSLYCHLIFSAQILNYVAD